TGTPAAASESAGTGTPAAASEKAGAPTGAPAAASKKGPGTGPPAAVAAPPAPRTAPGRGSVVDTTFNLTPTQRTASTKVLTAATEDMGGEKPQAATGLTAKGRGATVAKQLRAPIPLGETAPPITKPTLLKEPSVTSRNVATSAD